MKALLDTSVLVAAMVEAHPVHGSARSWLTRMRAGEVELVVASHSLAETYAVLTTLPVKPRISPLTALRLIQENLLERVQVVALDVADTTATVEQLARLGLAGGLVYDGLLARVAARAAVDRLVTLNPDHFRRAWPEGAERVSPP